LGTDHFDPRLDEPNLVLHAGDDHALEPGERRGTPVSSVRAAVAPRRRQAANIPLGAVVVRGHRRVVQEGKQLDRSTYRRSTCPPFALAFYRRSTWAAVLLGRLTESPFDLIAVCLGRLPAPCRPAVEPRWPAV
jgi:hypothetical protein